MAERDERLKQLPGVLALGWWMFMRPISLHERLRSLGISDYNDIGLSGLQQDPVERLYMERARLLIASTPPLISAVVLLILATLGVELDFAFAVLGVAVGVAVGLGVGRINGVDYGVAAGWVVGVALGVAGGVAGGVAAGVFGGVVVGLAVGTAIAFVAHNAVRLEQETLANISVLGGLVAIGALVDVVGDFAVGVTLGTALGLFRMPIYVIELITQVYAAVKQRLDGDIRLAGSPVLHHEASYLPLPFLAWQIVDTAARDPLLARRALKACENTPGQRRTGRVAQARIRAADLVSLAVRRAFQAVIDLHGDWLPGPEGAGPTLTAFRETARYLRAAELTLLPSQRRQQLESAQARLHGLENALLGARGPEARAYRPALAHWQRLVDDWLAETEAEAARVLPNPFRAGEPLEPEFGREVFRGREPLVTALEGILGDPSRAASVALIGPRRCGKTSLLKMLPLKLPDTQVIFFDVQDQPIDRPAAFVQALVREAQDQARRNGNLMLPGLGELQAGDRSPARGVGPQSGPHGAGRVRLADHASEQAAPAALSDADALLALRDWIERLETTPGLPRILLCIDEFERLGELYPDDGSGGRRPLTQLLGLIRATIQHRRRVRVLVAGAAPFEELDAIWNDHFVNLRELHIGHLDHDTVLGLLTRPSADFPPDCIPLEVAEAVWQRTLGQPYLTQLYGLLIVERLNEHGGQSGDGTGDAATGGGTARKQAEPADVAAVEPLLLDQAGYYLRHLVQSAPPPAHRILKRLAAGKVLPPNVIPGPTRRWLQRRCLLTDEGRLGIPVLGRFLHELE